MLEDGFSSWWPSVFVGSCDEDMVGDAAVASESFVSELETNIGEAMSNLLGAG